MVFVVILVALGLAIFVGLVVLYLKMGALADELRVLRAADAHRQAVQLDSIADKQQGTRHDLDRIESEIRTAHERIGQLALHIEGPPSMRRPVLPPAKRETPTDARVGQSPAT